VLWDTRSLLDSLGHALPLKTMSDPRVEFVLFDLGGVLIELGGVASLQELTQSVGDEITWHRWLTSPWVRRFEKGECSESEFSTGFVDEWQLDLPPQRFLDIFRDWPVGPFPGTEELLVEVQQSVPIGCLSNTNSMHWGYQSSQWPILGLFDFRFLSFELGLVKPDLAIFEAVADRLRVSRDRILYFDDVALNADAARSFGFRSEQVRGIDELRAALLDVGLVTD
jgi:HAD superfamily hydrolase (TIGR01509 family)